MTPESVFAVAYSVLIAYAILFWCVVAIAFKLARRTALLLSISNALIGLGGFLSVQRLDHSDWWYWNLADLLTIAGIVSFRASLIGFLIRKVRKTELTVFFIFITLAYLWVPSGPDSIKAFIVLFSFAACYVFIRLAQDIHLWHSQEDGRISVWWFSWPFWAISIRFLVTPAVAVLWSEEDYLRSVTEQPVAWTLFAYVMLVNTYMAIILIYRLVQRIRFYAEHDSLTNALNHRFFKESMSLHFDKNAKGSAAIVCFDLDDFKKINDTYGHSVGDQALVHAVQTVSKHLRLEDKIGRLGGEEFAVFLSACSPDQAKQVAERMCRALAESPLTINGESIIVTGSFGVVCAPASLEPKYILDTADHASYQAKSQGKNQVVFVDLVSGQAMNPL